MSNFMLHKIQLRLFLPRVLNKRAIITNYLDRPDAKKFHWYGISSITEIYFTSSDSLSMTQSKQTVHRPHKNISLTQKIISGLNFSVKVSLSTLRTGFLRFLFDTHALDQNSYIRRSECSCRTTITTLKFRIPRYG